jgi:hypothetical protein
VWGDLEGVGMEWLGECGTGEQGFVIGLSSVESAVFYIIQRAGLTLQVEHEDTRGSE